MNDLITAATSGLFVEVGKVIEHMKAQQARIADLERQLAEASAPAVEQHSYEHQRAVLEGERNAAADDYFSARELLDLVQNRRIFDAGFDRGFTARHCAPQAADTDKVREALKLAIRQNSCDMLMTGEEIRKCEAALHSMAAQAPVREVPGWQLVPVEPTKEMCDEIWCGQYPETHRRYLRMLAAAPLPAAPVQKGE